MNTTLLVLGIVLVLLIAYDVWLAWKKGPQATISYVMWTTGKNYPVLPLGIGILLGHFFWSQG